MNTLFPNRQQPEFNGAQLRTARHFWGMTLQEIADAITTTRQFVSQLETGKAKPGRSDAIVQALANAVEVHPEFLFRSERDQVHEEQAHFRKLAATKASTRQMVLARGTIFCQVVDFITKRVRLPEVNIPDHSNSTSAEQIERAAELTRMHWGLGLGPISHMVRVVERAGIVVAFFNEASAQVDALSIASKRPIIVRNDAKKSPFRQRFDIAHELGHLVLHEGQVTGDRKTETEANRFASAFLLPRSTFAKAFPRKGTRLDWAGIRQLKLTFGASKAAILYRARSLELIDEDHYRSAIITLKNRGEAIEEAEDGLVANELSELIPKSLDVLRDAHGISFADLAQALLISPDFLKQIVNFPSNEIDSRRPAIRVVH
ncbi:helix-turn-helix domain-containing protein [Stenotrophomonas maltophilia]|uniref:helix-turn-helix domain-containing protein n=1 Tax=Stenotrophomonas maltophilia TaxID=40324 RepID=UPI002805763C|nr:XRE family transcriptional regulator [Stenotrophomonas maltophilia]WME84446.1 XRE family transcriptional regulator [Stenotrophomonas maltophilia]